MKFTSKVTLIEFDRQGFLERLNQEMTEATKEAARSWLRTVLVNIPTWSRASRATFNELSEAVGYNLTFGPLVAYVDRLSLGLQTGRGGLQIKDNKSWHFFYETDLHYLAWNEFNTATQGDGSGWFSRHRSGPGPYRFQAAGAADFNSFAANVKLPNPIEFINPKRI